MAPDRRGPTFAGAGPSNVALNLGGTPFDSATVIAAPRCGDSWPAVPGSMLIPFPVLLADGGQSLRPTAPPTQEKEGSK